MDGKVVISYSGRVKLLLNPIPTPNPIWVFKKKLNPAHPRFLCSQTCSNRGRLGQVTQKTREIVIPIREQGWILVGSISISPKIVALCFTQKTHLHARHHQTPFHANKILHFSSYKSLPFFQPMELIFGLQLLLINNRLMEIIWKDWENSNYKSCT